MTTIAGALEYAYKGKLHIVLKSCAVDRISVTLYVGSFSL